MLPVIRSSRPPLRPPPLVLVAMAVAVDLVMSVKMVVAAAVILKVEP